MSKIYTFYNTSGTLELTLAPNGIDGAVKSGASSDANLIGQGATLWGESFNESLYRIVENFACPEKVASPGVPQDENDLATGQGINQPIPGQLWFNTTTSKLLAFDEGAAAFINPSSPVVGGTAPASPIAGDLWYDNSNVDPLNHQLKVYVGVAPTGSFDSVADRYLQLDGLTEMYGNLEINKISPSIQLRANDDANAFVYFRDSGDFARGSIRGNTANGNVIVSAHDAAGSITESFTVLEGGNVQILAAAPTAVGHLTRKDYVDTTFVDVAGDTMTGDLIFNSGVDLMFEAGHHRITNNDGGGNFNVRVGHEYDGGEIYTQAGGAVHLLATHEGSNPSFTVKLGDGFTNVIGNPVTFSGSFVFSNDGNVSANAAAPTGNSHLTRKDYVDTEIANAAGAVVPSGTVTMFAGSAAPSGYLLCNGSSVSTAAYPNLFAVIGYTYGGSGGTFNVPDMKGRLPGGVGTTSPVPSHGSGSLSLGQKLGQWYSRLTSINQMPSHNHNGGNHRHYLYMGGGSSGPRTALAVDTSHNTSHSYTGNNDYTEYSGNTISSQGSSSNIDTYPPILGLNFIIKT